MEKTLLKHCVKLLRCSFFSAPRQPVKPYMIPEGIELIEIITAGEVHHPEYGCKVGKRGTIFWHQAGEYTVWRTPPDDPYRCLVLAFEVDERPRQVSRVNNWGVFPELSTFAEDMLNFSRRDELDDELVLLYALGTLARQLVKTPSLPRAVRRACRFMGSDPAENYTIAQMAEKSGVSESRLFSLFQQHLHISPHQYLLERKVDMAKELLISRNDIPIKQIAEMCGFSSLELFYRRFKSQLGVTPAKFRNQTADNR